MVFLSVNVFWRLWIFTAFQSYKLLGLSCTHLHFSELNFIPSFSSHVPKLSRCLCSKHCYFQFSSSICCAPVWACLNKFFSSGLVIGCTVIYIFLNEQYERHLQITWMCFSIDIRGSIFFHALTLKSWKKITKIRCINYEYLLGFVY